MIPAPRVLLVDDDKDWLDLARGWLADTGFEIDSVERGADALERLAAQSYVAVLIDLRMPAMDGWSLAARIRERMGLELPLILLTSVENVRGLSDGLLAGANCYLSKAEARTGRLPDLLQGALEACR
ncbi:MAG: response regulator [Deltaproteobacteria bacterium]